MSEADHLVARGLRAFNLFGGSGGAASRGHLDEARAYLTRALALDPANARGLCAMGNLLSVEGAYGIAPREASLKRGREMIFAALAADDRCAEVHCSMGKIALYYDDDVHAAERHIRRAVELEPSEPEALRLLSIVYKILGRAEDAVDAARAATERAPESAPLWNALGDALLAAGRNAEAVDVLKRAISLLPGYGPALERLERAHIALGEFDPALEIRCSRMRLAGQRERADLLEAEARRPGRGRRHSRGPPPRTGWAPPPGGGPRPLPRQRAAQRRRTGSPARTPNSVNGAKPWTGWSGRTSGGPDDCGACWPTCPWTIAGSPSTRAMRA